MAAGGQACDASTMGYGNDVICVACETKSHVSEGSGMVAMPFHCDRCGKEWWWEFGEGGPFGKSADPPPCDCGGSFSVEAPARCPKCGSTEYRQDPDGMSLIYD